VATKQADDCCTCEPDTSGPVCDAALQQAYDDQKAAILKDLDDPACQSDDQCTVIPLINACRAQCAIAVFGEIAEAFTKRVDEWAADNCSACPMADIACDAVMASAHCFEEKCVLEIAQ
jgi:hypothetical protein